MKKIYTTYLANLKNIQIKDVPLIIVMRMAPAAFNSDDKYIKCPTLSPYINDLIQYKKDGDFELLKEKYINMIENDNDAKQYINYAVEVLEHNDGNDICFICCEKDKDMCHRTILANYISKITSCEVIEL